MSDIKFMKNAVIGAAVGAMDDPLVLAAVKAAIEEQRRRHEVLSLYLVFGYPVDLAERMIASFEENGHDPLVMLGQLGHYKSHPTPQT